MQKKKIELSLFRNTLPDLLNTYNNRRESKISYYFLPPKKNDNYREEEIIFNLGCLCNPDYFKINHVHISFDHWSTTKHQEFWENLKIKLIELSEYK